MHFTRPRATAYLVALTVWLGGFAAIVIRGALIVGIGFPSALRAMSSSS